MSIALLILFLANSQLWLLYLFHEMLQEHGSAPRVCTLVFFIFFALENGLGGKFQDSVSHPSVMQPTVDWYTRNL